MVGITENYRNPHFPDSFFCKVRLLKNELGKGKMNEPYIFLIIYKV